MIRWFLNLKHWHLFILTTVLPLGVYFVMMGFMVKEMTRAIAAQVEPDPFIAFGYFKYFPLIMFCYLVFLLGWFYAAGVGLQAVIPSALRRPTTLFQLALGFVVLYFVLLSSVFFNMDYLLTGTVLSPWIIVILPLHLLSIAGIFYSMYFVAKTIKTAELGRSVGFGDFVGEFFLIWFYFVGVWILQPRINKLINSEPDTEKWTDISRHLQ